MGDHAEDERGETCSTHRSDEKRVQDLSRKTRREEVYEYMRGQH
jgi:hypothetical protein